MIKLNVKYPTRSTAPDANYIYGGAQNITAPGDGTGTPWELAIINDLNGMMQALVVDAGIVPSGSAETVVASDTLDAIKVIIQTIADASKMQYSGATVHSAVMPTTHTDLDLSGIVGSNRAFVYLSVEPDVDATVEFRVNGEAKSVGWGVATSSAGGGGSSVASIKSTRISYLSIITDASGIVEWLSDFAGTTTTVKLLSYQVLG